MSINGKKKFSIFWKLFLTCMTRRKILTKILTIDRSFWKKNSESSLEGKNRTTKKVIEGIKHTVCTAGKKALHRRSFSTGVSFKKSSKNGMSSNKHKLCRRNAKCKSASEKAWKQDESFFSESKPRVQKIESNGDDSNFECYDKLDRKPVHVDVDREITRSSGRYPTFTLLPKISVEEAINNW